LRRYTGVNTPPECRVTSRHHRNSRLPLKSVKTEDWLGAVPA
jgi:hypothetical protein